MCGLCLGRFRYFLQGYLANCLGRVRFYGFTRAYSGLYAQVGEGFCLRIIYKCDMACFGRGIVLIAYGFAGRSAPGAAEAIDNRGVETIEGFAGAGRNDPEVVGDENEAAFAFFVEKIEIRYFTLRA